MKIINFFILTCLICFVTSCSDKTNLDENSFESTNLETEDNPLIAEYKAILNGKSPEDSFLKNLKFYDTEGNIISRDEATADLRCCDPFLFSYEEESLVTDFCCNVELEIADAMPGETWFVTTKVIDHVAIEIEDVLYARRLTFVPLTGQTPTTFGNFWTSFSGTPCGDNMQSMFVAGYAPGSFPSGKYEVTADIGFWKHNNPIPPPATVEALYAGYELCDKDSKEAFYE